MIKIYAKDLVAAEFGNRDAIIKVNDETVTTYEELTAKKMCIRQVQQLKLSMS